MYMCVYMCVYTYIYIYTYTYIHRQRRVRAGGHTRSGHLDQTLYVCVYTYIYTYTYIYLHCRVRAGGHTRPNYADQTLGGAGGDRHSFGWRARDASAARDGASGACDSARSHDGQSRARRGDYNIHTLINIHTYV